LLVERLLGVYGEGRRGGGSYHMSCRFLRLGWRFFLNWLDFSGLLGLRIKIGLKFQKEICSVEELIE